MMTHDDLIVCGKEWLSKPYRNTGHGEHGCCSVIVTDMSYSGSETPDVIGWHAGYTTLIECKASRSDFRADAKKYCRRLPHKGLGFYRYYMTPKGLITLKELPEKWGLVEVSNTGKTRVKRPAESFGERNLKGEVDILLSLIRRLKVEPENHVSIRAFTEMAETKSDPRATVTFIK